MFIIYYYHNKPKQKKCSIITWFNYITRFHLLYYIVCNKQQITMSVISITIEEYCLMTQNDHIQHTIQYITLLGNYYIISSTLGN